MTTATTEPLLFKDKPIEKLKCPGCGKKKFVMAQPWFSRIPGMPREDKHPWCLCCGAWYDRIVNPPKAWKDMTEEERRTFNENSDLANRCIAAEKAAIAERRQ